MLNYIQNRFPWRSHPYFNPYMILACLLRPLLPIYLPYRMQI
ncbi:hypothetical protein GXM_08045 [Nostoc sphaeroides CCNUC1]|uniref:Uncharacterized protein n=1 Tax=Nostoc sphaeroides CCNUC1 TaxID=2653204 RepID=A0A5P8WD98_9NOSO|nr:hypothetical protein GXM_08045 [Nostoc sphaeroides CCNUC1]